MNKMTTIYDLDSKSRVLYRTGMKHAEVERRMHSFIIREFDINYRRPIDILNEFALIFRRAGEPLEAR